MVISTVRLLKSVKMGRRLLKNKVSQGEADIISSKLLKILLSVHLINKI